MILLIVVCITKCRYYILFC